MDDPQEILRRARERAAQQQLPYAGALTPAEAHTMMRHGARLVDVRTRAEWEWVGRAPDGRGATGLLEELISGWRGKLVVLTMLGFAAADFVITRSLSLADATVQHILPGRADDPPRRPLAINDPPSQRQPIQITPLTRDAQPDRALFEVITPTISAPATVIAKLMPANLGDPAWRPSTTSNNFTTILTKSGLLFLPR